MKNKSDSWFGVIVAVTFCLLCIWWDGHRAVLPVIVHQRGTITTTVMWDYWMPSTGRVVYVDWSESILTHRPVIRETNYNQWIRPHNPLEPWWP